MADLATVARIGARVDALGGIWMGRPVMEVGAAMGFTGYPWPFYMVGRGGVLGDVAPEQLSAAMVFPSPGLVRTAWAEGRQVLSPEAGVARFIGCAYDWASVALGPDPELERATALLDQLAAAVDVSEVALADGWRSVSHPADLPKRAVWAIQVIREHRGGVHAACVAKAGLSPVEAVMATEGEQMAAMYGWEGPYPDPVTCTSRKEAAEAATNEAVGCHYAVLEDDDLTELARLLDAVAEHVAGIP